MRISDWSSDVCSSDLLQHIDGITLQDLLDIPFEGFSKVENTLRDGKSCIASLLRLGVVVSHLFVLTGGVFDVPAFTFEGVLSPKECRIVPLGVARHRRSEAHTSDLKSLMRYSYVVF